MEGLECVNWCLFGWGSYDYVKLLQLTLDF